MKRWMKVSRIISMATAPLFWIAPFVPIEHLPHMVKRDPSGEWVTIMKLNKGLGIIFLCIGALFLVLSSIHKNRHISASQIFIGAFLAGFTIFLHILGINSIPYAYYLIYIGCLGQVLSGWIKYVKVNRVG